MSLVSAVDGGMLVRRGAGVVGSEMWAQDAAAVYGYAGSSATAAHLAPFTGPPPPTDPAAAGGPGAAVAHAASTSADTNTPSVSAQLVSAIPRSLQSLASPTVSVVPAVSAAAGPSSPVSILGTLTGPFSPLSLVGPTFSGYLFGHRDVRAALSRDQGRVLPEGVSIALGSRQRAVTGSRARVRDTYGPSTAGVSDNINSVVLSRY